MPELLPHVGEVAVAEHRADEGRPGDGKDSRRRPGRDEREPGGRHDVARDASGVEPDSRERDGRDEAERRGRHRDERGCRQVGVAEARHRPDALARRERKADEVDRLQRERERRAPAGLEQPVADPLPGRADGAPRHRLAARPHEERERRQGDGEEAVERHPDRDGVDPVRIDAHEDVSEARDARDDVRDRRREVVVERREGAGGEPRVELPDRGEDHQRHDALRRVPRSLGAEPRQHRGRGPCREERDDEQRDGDDGEGHRPRRGLLSETPLDARTAERRQDDEADRGRREGEDDEDAVGGEEPVRLGRATELACDDDADDRGQPGLDGERERGDRARRERPMAG